MILDSQKSLQFAQSTRNSLRSLQAQPSNLYRFDRTVHELLLGITWRVAERLSGNKLPR
jgi:hypothetical protein